MIRKVNMLFSSKPKLIPTVSICWLILFIIYEIFIYKDIVSNMYSKKKGVEILLVLINQAFVGSFFWLGISNLAIAYRYIRVKNKYIKSELSILNHAFPDNWNPKVQLLYTTYNDFLPYALLQCMQQSYTNTRTIILDNSTDPTFIKLIDDFVVAHPETELIRDSNNKHAKAGNLNNYLCGIGKGTYDYFVILDSDELLEKTFVEKCLKIFFYNDIGILQCNHISGQNHNSFMGTFSKSGNIFWPVQNIVRSCENGWIKKGVKESYAIKNRGAIAIELGHGVMISRECFEDIGAIPYAVAEDLCTSIEAILKGWNIKFAATIYGNEAFPVNMSALQIRSSKFCSANIEFFRKYASRVIQSKKISFYQKVDLFCFTLSVPISAFQYLSLVLTSMIFPELNIPMVNELFILVPVFICYFSQIIVDGLFQLFNNKKLSEILLYELQATILYGSFYYTTVKSTFMALLNKPAKFVVTPKVNNRISLKGAFSNHYQGILFSLVTILICMIISGSNWVLLSFLPGCLGFLFELKANYKTKEEAKTEAKLEYYNKAALNHKKNEVIEFEI